MSGPRGCSSRITLYVIALIFALFVQKQALHRVIDLTSGPPPPDASGPPAELLAVIKKIQRAA